MKESSIIAVCGDVCSECPRYKATKANDINKLAEVAELWFRLGFRDKIVNPSGLRCNGCSKENACAHSVNNCEHLNGSSNCGKCDYFPCKKINMVFKRTDQVNELCKAQCTDDEYEELCKAFLMKRQILEESNKHYKTNKE
jgi:hypothetical protein